MQRAVAVSGVPELVRAWQDEQVHRSLAELRELLLGLQASGGGWGPVGRLAVGVVPQAADCFQERQAAARLAEVLAGGGTAVLSGVLTGMGGVGKTQLAAAYARHAWADGEAEVMVWVTASSRPGIVAAYADAAHRLGAAPAGSDPGEAANRFLEWANTAPVRWLVVLDDIQDPDDLRGLWPAPRRR